MIASQRLLEVKHFTAWINPLFWFQLYWAMHNYDWLLWAFTNSHNEEFSIAIESIESKALSMLFKTSQLRSQKYLREVNVSVPTLTFPSRCFIGIHFTTERDKNINKKKTDTCSCLHPHGKCPNCHSYRGDELVLKFVTTLLLRLEKENIWKEAERIHMEDHSSSVLHHQLKPCWYLSFLAGWDTTESIPVICTVCCLPWLRE